MAEEKHCGLRIWDGGRDGKNGQGLSRMAKFGLEQTCKEATLAYEERDERSFS